MFTLDQEKVNQLLQAISSGFVESPKQIIIFSVVVVAFLGLLVFFYVYQLKKSKKKKLRHTQEIYENIILRTNLTDVEKSILKRMSKYLKEPATKAQLLEQESTFNYAARKLQSEDKVPEDVLAVLRIKLGFRAPDIDQIPYTSAALPVGMPLVIAQKGKRKITGRIQELDSHSFVISLDHGSLPPEEGSPVRVYFKNISGLFGFSSVVQISKNNIVRLRHSETIKKFQRRDYYRKKIRLPAYIKKTSSQERPVASTIIDLGGGGASLLNPDSRYKVGDSIYLTFFLTHDSKFELTVRVVRSSNKDKYMHVEFLSIPEESRDRIIGLLYRSTV